MSVYVEAGKVTIRTRNGHDWTRRIPAIARAAEEHQIEGIEYRLLGPVLVEVGLQIGERGATAIVENHRLAVENGRANVKRCDAPPSC